MDLRYICHFSSELKLNRQLDVKRPVDPPLLPSITEVMKPLLSEPSAVASSPSVPSSSSVVPSSPSASSQTLPSLTQLTNSLPKHTPLATASKNYPPFQIPSLYSQFSSPSRQPLNNNSTAASNDTATRLEPLHQIQQLAAPLHLDSGNIFVSLL